MSWKNVPAAWSRAQSLRDEQLDEGRIQDLIRDAHTIKGSAGLLGYDEIKEVASGSSICGSRSARAIAHRAMSWWPWRRQGVSCLRSTSTMTSWLRSRTS